MSNAIPICTLSILIAVSFYGHFQFRKQSRNISEIESLLRYYKATTLKKKSKSHVIHRLKISYAKNKQKKTLKITEMQT